MLIYFWLFAVFILGAVVGSFCNVAISRLPLEKSMIWPSSRCGHCFQPIRWYHNIPLLSYWVLKGKCRNCGAPFSIQYFLVELGCGLGWMGLFYLEVMQNIHGWPDRGRNWAIQNGLYPWEWWAGFVFHAILFSFLLVASVCDLNGREIPFSLTFTGTLVGLLGAVLFPWPFPWLPGEATPKPQLQGMEWLDPHGGLRSGIYPWPVWGPVPAWLAPGGDWRMGLATGLAGFMVGTLLMRGVAFLASAGLGKEALGLGDADLMMMAGAFLGWQPVVAALFISIVPALAFGLFLAIFRGQSELPFGPSLATGVIITMLAWKDVGGFGQPLFFFGSLLAIAVIGGAVLMYGLSLMMRLVRR